MFDLFILIFSTGLLAAFSPCVVVLLPALFYRFSKKQTVKENTIDISLFILAFLGTFILAGVVIESISNSMIRSGVQLGIGLLFIVLGVLSLLNRFNPFQFPLIKHPAAYGGIFAFIIAINPCAFAYVGVLTTTITLPYAVVLFIFALGLLTPALLMSLFGRSLITRIAAKSSKVTTYLTKMFDVLLILTGIYLIYVISAFSLGDAIASSILLVVLFGLIIRAFFAFNGKSLKDVPNVLLLLALLGIIIAAFTHCSAYIPISMETSGNFCAAHAGDCEICNRCITTFVVAGVIGLLAILLKRYWNHIKEWIKKKKK